MALNYILTSNSITILIKNRPEIIDNTHPNFEKVEIALKEGADETEILHLMNVAKAITNFGEGNVIVENGTIKYKGEEVHSALGKRILTLMEQGFNITPFTNFMENLYLNPSKSAVDGLYGFLEACDLPITEDGHFLAYKKINKHYKDCYSNTFDNSIGASPEMPREAVDGNSNQTCSTGLHVASYSYMKSYGGDRIVVCQVNPKDVVAVPNDYNNAKMRVCKYLVINEVGLNGEEITPNVISKADAHSKEYGKEALPTVEEEFDKDLFSAQMESYLEGYTTEHWNKLGQYFLSIDIDTLAGSLQVSLELKDSKTIIAILNRMAEQKKFKREDLIKYL